MGITIQKKAVTGFKGQVWAVEHDGRLLFVEGTKRAAERTLGAAQTCPNCHRLVREGQFICPDCNTPTAAYFAYLEREREKGLPTND